MVVIDERSLALAAAASAVRPAPSFGAAAQSFLQGVVGVLNLPAALLSRSKDGWRFEAEAFPQLGFAARSPAGATVTDPEGGEVAASAARGWTGMVLGFVGSREWVLMLPGKVEDWHPLVPSLDGFFEETRRSLERMSAKDDEAYVRRLSARVHAFSRRLARTVERSQIHSLVLRTMARQVSARVGAIAMPEANDEALTITATHGYPHVVVEQVRIEPGEGVFGRAFLSQRPYIAHAEQPRLRYRTASYIVLPLVNAGRTLGVVALTDRADGRPFDSRDLSALRILSGPSVLALAGERLHESVNDLTRAATVDAVTGLFNRRHFESRIRSEIQRAKRQNQDLALLMVDVDDFKRVNDTLGHLEGDRTLREVADLLKGGVRIFDVCARFGGEEFAILMPGAGTQMAAQVAERIRVCVEERSRSGAMPITVSIGVGTLAGRETPEELIGAADSALIAAKRAGKNIVQVDG